MLYIHELIKKGLAIAGLSILSACASTPDTQESSVLPPPETIISVAGASEYRVGPSDLLAISVFQVQDLEREVRVNNAGQITLPLIGAVKVAGLTVDELENTLASMLKERWLQNPQVSVFVKDFASQRVTVGGEVDKPGIFPISGTRMTLLQSLASAEGLTDIASRQNILVLRKAGGQMHYARFDLDAIEAGQIEDPVLAPEDVVIVDSSSGRKTLKTMIQLAPFIAVWRAYR